MALGAAMLYLKSNTYDIILKSLYHQKATALLFRYDRNIVLAVLV